MSKEDKIELVKITSQDQFDQVAHTNYSNLHTVSLSDSVVSCDITIEKPPGNIQITIHFENVIFEKNLFLNWINFNQLHIDTCTFNTRLILLEKRLTNFTVKDSIFVNGIDCSNSTIKARIDISANRFLGDASFGFCKFENGATISDNDFYRRASFIANNFNGNFDFSHNSFREGANFNDSIFEGKFNGWGINGYSKIVDFNGVIFKKDSILTQSNFHNGLSLYATIIKESLDLNDIEIYGENTGSETLRIIKNFFLKQNNRRQALKFHEQEMNAHWNELKEFNSIQKKELKALKKKKKNLKNPSDINLNNLELHDEIHEVDMGIADFKERRRIYNRDKTILKLNKITNNYGLSWGKAFRFILKYSIILYLLYVTTLILSGSYPYKFGWTDWANFWESIKYTLKYYLQFLWPTHKFDFIPNVESNFLSYLIDIISRIVIGFGIYQMIQAFRKFGKV